MVSLGKKYPADCFKRDLFSSVNSIGEFHSEANESESSSQSVSEPQFNSDDKKISILYREIVDDLMDLYKLRESTVDIAIQNMKEKIHLGHKNDFRKFPGINFCSPKNCCAYLRRYAVCYTGLVKKSMWDFFTHERFTSKIAADEIVNNNQLKIVSLGGGAGNDIIGFCSALQEIPNNIQELELIIVDIDEGWKPVFPKLLRKAKGADFGSFSQCLQKKIIIGFMEADLTNDEVYRDENLSRVLGQADVLLMVKLTSFLCYDDADNLLQNVIDSMKPNSKLVYIDQRYNEQFFRKIGSLNCIYYHTLTYELCFNPRRFHSPSIDTAYAHVAILEKKSRQDEDYFDNEDT